MCCAGPSPSAHFAALAQRLRTDLVAESEAVQAHVESVMNALDPLEWQWEVIGNIALIYEEISGDVIT